MLVGVPSEIKEQESRVGLTPSSVKKLVNYGNEVLIQNNAGFGAGFENSEYEQVGAKIVRDATSIFNNAVRSRKINIFKYAWTFFYFRKRLYAFYSFFSNNYYLTIFNFTNKFSSNDI